MTRCLVIINPVAGGGKPTRYAMALEWQLSTMFDRIEVKFTRQAGDAILFAKEATEDGFDAVFCLGGDGTVNETVNGIMKGGGTATFGFVPVGTVNDLARALDVPLSPLRAIHMLADADVMSVDVGRCNDSYFCNNIASGVIPTAVEGVGASEKAVLGPLAYFMRGGQALLQNQDYEYEISTDEAYVETKSPLVIALMTNCISSFEKFMPDAEVNDGFMRIVIFREYFFMEILAIIPLILSGKIYNSKYVSILKTKKASIRVKNHDEVVTNMDGSKGPELPAELEVLPGALKVFVPKKKLTKSLLNPLHLKGLSFNKFKI